jgi:predicted DNA-binding antitoxin AbrB/MazE fold protein
MQESIDAIYEHGVFKPLKRLNISDGMRVRLIVETVSEADEMIALATQVYDGLSEKDIDEIEQIASDRRDFFKR